MCILVLCQHKCFFSHESFAFLIHSFFPSFISRSRSCSASIVVFIILCFAYIHHVASFYSRQFHYRFKILLFNCFFHSILFELCVDLLSFSVLTFFSSIIRFYFSFCRSCCSLVAVSVSVLVIPSHKVALR